MLIERGLNLADQRGALRGVATLQDAPVTDSLHRIVDHIQWHKKPRKKRGKWLGVF
tara:strand:+ start:13389 stop:13556 length:168 start_codon:yes stop_codon:yes gene_type:complete